MTLQTSGAITFLQVQTEFGGVSPISLSEYYRNGTFVPSSITTGQGSWSGYTGSTGSNGYYWSNLYILVWAGSQISTSWNGSGTFTSGGYDYQRESTHFATTYDKFAGTIYYYKVRRRTSGTTITVNSNVPTSGAISMDDFYGGRKT